MKPEPPPAPAESTDWVYVWLKSHDLRHLASIFTDEALVTQGDVLEAPIDQETLKAMGVRKIGERSKLLRLIEQLRKS